MAPSRPKMLLVCDKRVRETYLAPEEIERLEVFADWQWVKGTGGIFTRRAKMFRWRSLEASARDVDDLIVCHGAPKVLSPDLAGQCVVAVRCSDLSGTTDAAFAGQSSGGRTDSTAKWMRLI